jgi:dolichyl-phosphate-mannose-protein mannosyltransferase
MASPAGSMRQRNTAPFPTKKKDASSTGIAAPRDPELDALVKANLTSKGPGSEWDYKLALVAITVLAFVTRFWGISHPNEVVFDEVHFGKVSALSPENSRRLASHNS